MISFLCGVLSGIITGFGAGGGLFLIMLLSWVSNFSQIELQTINLIYYISTAIFSVLVYSKDKNVDFKVGIRFIIIAMFMAILGANLAHKIDTRLLRKLFAIYVIGAGVFFLISAKKVKQ